MAVLALTSAKGAPGVSTAALAMTLLWPRAALLAECDPAGGSSVLAGHLRGEVDHSRGLLPLALAQQGSGGVRGPEPAGVHDHIRAGPLQTRQQRPERTPQRRGARGLRGVGQARQQPAVPGAGSGRRGMRVAGQRDRLRPQRLLEGLVPLRQRQRQQPSAVVDRAA